MWVTRTWQEVCQWPGDTGPTAGWKVERPTAVQCRWLCCPCREACQSWTAAQSLAIQTLRRRRAEAQHPVTPLHTNTLISLFLQLQRLSTLSHRHHSERNEMELQMHWISYLPSNRKVFSLFLNTACEMSGARSSAGRLFQPNMRKSRKMWATHRYYRLTTFYHSALWWWVRSDWHLLTVHDHNSQHPGTMHQSAQMSKITNDSLTLSGTGCYIAAPIWQQWASKDQYVQHSSNTNKSWLSCTTLLTDRRIRPMYQTLTLCLWAIGLISGSK